MTTTGRPPKNPTCQRFFDKPLYRLLVDRLPPPYVKDGTLDTAILAKDCKRSRYSVYRWLNDCTMSMRSANTIVKLSKPIGETEARIKIEELIPFMNR